MPKRSTSQRVPKDMQARFEEITQRTSAFCQTYLNDEYEQFCRELTATLCRKRPSPLVRGTAATWVCGIIHALGMVNFPFDSSQTPHLAGQIQADPRSAGHVSHGPGLVDSRDGGQESPHLDALGQWTDDRCAPCAT
jgi:hypothetical protein